MSGLVNFQIGGTHMRDKRYLTERRMCFFVSWNAILFRKCGHLLACVCWKFTSLTVKLQENRNEKLPALYLYLVEGLKEARFIDEGLPNEFGVALVHIENRTHIQLRILQLIHGLPLVSCHEIEGHTLKACSVTLSISAWPSLLMCLSNATRNSSRPRSTRSHNWKLFIPFKNNRVGENRRIELY